jgi:hypothetical protein
MSRRDLDLSSGSWSHLRVLEAASGGSRDLMRAVLAGVRCVFHDCDMIREHRILLEAYAMTSGSGWAGHVALEDAGFVHHDPTIALSDAASVLIDAVDEVARMRSDDSTSSRWDLASRLSSAQRRQAIDRGLARDGFHRVGRLDAPGRRSLWIREEVGGALEIVAGREGGDGFARVTRDDPSYESIAGVMSCARFAAEFEDVDEDGLDRSYSLDRHPRSIHRTACSCRDHHLVGAIACFGCGRPFCSVCCLRFDGEPGMIHLLSPSRWFCDDDSCIDLESNTTGCSTSQVVDRHAARVRSHDRS